jgi:hypothetical protein
VAWDLTSEQQRLCMARSTDGHLIVRVYLNSLEEPPVEEVRVQPESFSTFIRVARGGARYLAELGCRDQSGEWTRLAVSQVVVTPWEGVSEDTSVQFATIPPAVKLEEFLELITTLVAEKVPITEAIQQLRSSGDTLLLRTSADLTPRRWTSAEAKALAEAVGMDTSLGTGMGSLEMAEMVRQRGQEWVDQPAVLPPPAVRQIEEQAGAVGAVASPVEAFAPPERKGPFWFNINAELVVYGATEPDAQVGIGSRRIQLRPDGTFSFRFALPDGNYDLKVLAVSADGQDARLAELRFARDTHYTGDVGVHPQDPSLKIPAAANVS